MAQMISNYDGTKCATCNTIIKKGEQIDYRGKGNTHHWRCASPVIERTDEEANALADELGFLPKNVQRHKRK